MCVSLFDKSAQVASYQIVSDKVSGRHVELELHTAAWQSLISPLVFAFRYDLVLLQ